MTNETYNPSRDSDDEAFVAADAATDEDTTAETERLVSDIDDTRARMTDTVHAIGEKLDPQNVVSQAKETVREATIGRVEQMANDTGYAIQQTGGGIVETVRSNPIPAAMTAFGLWMLWKNRRTGYSYGDGNRDWAYGRYAGPSSRPDLYGRGEYRADGGTWSGSSGPGPVDRARETASGAADAVGQRVSGAADTVSQTVSGAADTVGQTFRGVGDTASQVPERAGEVAQRASWELNRILEENPLAVGAIALAAGAAAGLVLPTTQPERRYLGEARDRVIEQAESKAHEALDKVEEQTAKA